MSPRVAIWEILVGRAFISTVGGALYIQGGLHPDFNFSHLLSKLCLCGPLLQVTISVSPLFGSLFSSRGLPPLSVFFLASSRFLSVFFPLSAICYGSWLEHLQEEVGQGT